MTHDEVMQFLEIDERLFLALHNIGLRDELPKHDLLARHIDAPVPGMEPSPPVAFEGKCNLPGDWDKGLFVFESIGWLEAMKPLRELLRRGPTISEELAPKPASSSYHAPEWTDSTLSLDVRATSLFVASPTLTKREMAEKLQCHDRSLAPKRCPKLDKAMGIYKAKPDVLCGSKDADGNLEAWEKSKHAE
jgi:hypothetical protein